MNMKNTSSVNETFCCFVIWVVLSDVDNNDVIEKTSYSFNNIKGEFVQIMHFWISTFRNLEQKWLSIARTQVHART